MKASEIKAVITARPDAVFVTRDGDYVRIAEVIESNKQVLTSKGYETRTQVKYVVDKLFQITGVYLPANASINLEELNVAPSTKVWGRCERILPQAISRVHETSLTLEALGEAWLVEEQERYERDKQARRDRDVLIDELMAITGISRYILKRTDDEVLAFISKAVKQSATV